MFPGRKRATERVGLIRTILASFLDRAPGAAEIESFAAGIPDGATPAAIAERVLAILNPPTAPRFVPPGHHYSPIPPTAEVDRHLRRIESLPVPEAMPGIDLDRATMTAFWAELLPLLAEIPFGAEPRPPLRYGLENPAYAWGDGSILYAMLRRFRPRRVIEIGSGWSTICTLDTVEAFLGGETSVTLIEPYADLVRTLTGAGRPATAIHECAVQDVPLQTFDALEDGDVLFIDSTHVLRTGSDVSWELFEILPRLKPGVLVHVHDIFWPFEYPRFWAVDENRAWTEIYALRAFLTGNAAWRILMFNDYFAKLERPLIERTYPDFLRNPGGAIWLRKAAP